MRDYLELGPTPAEEDCVQVGTDDYLAKARVESKVWVDQLERKYPDLDFRLKSFPHDFGTYLEVVIMYDDDDPKEVKAVFRVEATLPRHWDKVAKKLLVERKTACASMAT